MDELLATTEIRVALTAALLSVAGWIGVKIFEWLSANARDRRKRREAIIHFYADVKLTLDFCDGFAKGRADTKATVLTYDRPDRPYRAYIAQSRDEAPLQSIAATLHALPAYAIQPIWQYIGHSRLMVIYYGKLSSDEFANLETERKLRVVDQFYDILEELLPLARYILHMIECLPEMGSVQKSLQGADDRSGHGKPHAKS